MLLEEIRSVTHRPTMRFKTEITEARKKAVDSALAVVRKRAQQGETSAAERITVNIKW